MKIYKDDGKIEKIEVYKQECFSCDVWIVTTPKPEGMKSGS